MLTPDQEAWIAHLSDVDRIRIVPFDTTAAAKFEMLKQRLHTALGTDIHVEHHGATSLGISGQDEIDVYIPVPASELDRSIGRLTALLGEPRSHYPGRRARFAVDVDGKHVDVFPINREHEDWQRLLRFETYLRAHPDALDAYRRLKEQGDSLSVREYYRRKNLFFNEVLARAARVSGEIDPHSGLPSTSVPRSHAETPVHISPNPARGGGVGGDIRCE